MNQGLILVMEKGSDGMIKIGLSKTLQEFGWILQWVWDRHVAKIRSLKSF
jgi:hypothetical protein